MNAAIIGYGKMGREIERLLVERGHGVGLIVDADNRGDLDAAHLRGIDVALEFTTPATAYDNSRACIDAGTPVVSGTTGWTDRLDELKTRCKERGGAFFYASNYSLGVNLLFRLNRQLAEMVGRVGGYDVRIEEVHHTQKKDAPSGTAITLAEEIIDRIGTKERWVNRPAADPSELAIASIREGGGAGYPHRHLYLGGRRADAAARDTQPPHAGAGGRHRSRIPERQAGRLHDGRPVEIGGEARRFR